MSVTMEHTDEILKKIKDLPPLPLVVQQLLKVMEDDNSSANDISQVLNSDQAMASKVLKLVNSSFYGLSGKVSTVPRAIVILGVAALRNLALGMGVAKVMSGAATGNLQEKFWDHSIATAAACEVLARHTGKAVPEEAFVAGLLHDIGHLIMLMALPDEFQQVINLGPYHMVENERKLIGMAHPQVGQKLLKHWKLPKLLSDAVRFHHTPKVFTGKDDPLISLVALGDLFSSVYGDIYERSICEADFKKLIKTTGLKPEEVNEILGEMESRITETRLFLKIALDEEKGSGRTSYQARKKIVMICTDPLRSEWTQQVLNHFGHTLISMKDFFAQASQLETVDLVILDPTSLKADQLVKLVPILKNHLDHMVLFGTDQKGEVAKLLDQDIRSIPVAFSREDLVIP